MVKVKIHWSSTVDRLSNISKSNLEHLDENGFYAIILGHVSPNGIISDRLLYIGQAYDQTIRQRLLQPHPADNCIKGWKKRNPELDIWVQAGVIREPEQRRITSQLIDDMECCMIFRNKPECNTQCIESYTGREIEIEHENGWILKDSACEETS